MRRNDSQSSLACCKVWSTSYWWDSRCPTSANEWIPVPLRLVSTVFTSWRYMGPGTGCHSQLLIPCVARVRTHFSGIFWDLLVAASRNTVITHNNYHTHLHCGVARIKIPPSCLSEQRAETLSEDRYLAGNLNVLNFFHMSIQDPLLFYWKAAWQAQLDCGALQKRILSVLSLCQRLMLKILLIDLPIINIILVENVPGSHERGWCSKAFLLCRDNDMETRTFLSGTPHWSLTDRGGAVHLGIYWLTVQIGSEKPSFGSLSSELVGDKTLLKQDHRRNDIYLPWWRYQSA